MTHAGRAARSRGGAAAGLPSFYIPLRLDAFMAAANARYYAERDPYADFTTAPEISQAFGEILGLWAVIAWREAGSPDPVVLAELGPGRGTLMADALRAVGRTCPAFRRAVALHLVDSSPRLRALTAARLPEAVFHEAPDTLPDGPLLLLANEFLDALPIRQRVRRGRGWTERHVSHGAFVEIPTDAPEDAPPAGEGEVVETCEEAQALATALARRLASDGGAALFVDYGRGERLATASLQALRAGRPADPLAFPGETDLSAHVDFAAFAAAARAAGADVHGPVAQGTFLSRLGLFQRIDRLARGRPTAEALALLEGARRLVEPRGMGRLFKVLAITQAGTAMPPGFEA